MGQSYDPEKWMIFQFDRPDLQGGLVNVMRRRKSCFDTAQICFRGLVPETVYVLDDADCGVIAEMSGADLMEKGLRLTLPEKGSAKLIFYRAK